MTRIDAKILATLALAALLVSACGSSGSTTEPSAVASESVSISAAARGQVDTALDHFFAGMSYVHKAAALGADPLTGIEAAQKEWRALGGINAPGIDGVPADVTKGVSDAAAAIVPTMGATVRCTTDEECRQRGATLRAQSNALVLVTSRLIPYSSQTRQEFLDTLGQYTGASAVTSASPSAG